MEKTEILIKRGFTKSEIKDHFAGIPDERWSINTISKEEINSADPNDTKQMDELYKKLFAKDSINCSIISPVFGLSFSEYRNELSNVGNYKIEASELEPYIARLILVLNRIGVMTVCSCDGWHKKSSSSMKIWMPERYSVIWMWLIMEYVFGENWNHQKAYYAYTWENKWEPEYECEMFPWVKKESRMVCRFKKKDALSIYERNNCYAHFLEEHAKAFTEINNKWIKWLQQNNSDIEIEGLGFLELRKLIYGYISSDLKGLQKCFHF